MIKISNAVKTKFTLKAVFNSKKINKDIIKVNNKITEFISEKEAVIYLGDKKKFNLEAAKASAKAIVLGNERGYQVDVQSFSSDDVSVNQIIRVLIETELFTNANLWTAKTKKKEKKEDLTLIELNDKNKKVAKEAIIFGESKNYARNLQIMPPNKLNSETFATKIKKDFAGNRNISIKVLDEKQITDLKMGLLLSVNLGSAYEPRVVVLEYKGNPKSKEKVAMVGKGITYDAGGYSVKVGRGMIGMKYDMSGAAIIAGAMKGISELKPKSNVVGVLMLTDNMINSIASKPDDVFIAMNGKSVEINNTDAEGRLALADGLTYAAKKLKATRLLDVATLTGAMLSALGRTYTGTWATTDKAWKDAEEAAKKADELIWRMPLHKDYLKFMKGTDVADLKNTALDGMGGSSTAAMFLTNFTEGVEYIHFDVAGTADINHKPMGALVKTLVEINK